MLRLSNRAACEDSFDRLLHRQTHAVDQLVLEIKSRIIAAGTAGTLAIAPKWGDPSSENRERKPRSDGMSQLTG